ncbi:(d)CMP kinase [Amphibacillus sp. MSJ-3]|uniref:(d)CMP kinase n=1 Tax=Amphibacillus sp. MSJ-3 TaxID=2841505 RepID=UPI001C0EEE99|nr:(d)CMP kinase [Amphibacillus sp. MSJ-3]MBU5594243.1 (d)CMP kinase [Amphibacillus sp. MSJ-3]
MKDKGIAIAIDGPAAAGKSTVAKKIANKLKYIYIDTGAMYRAITLKAIKQELDIDDEKALHQLLLQTEIKLIQSDQQQRVILDGHDVTEEIRNEAVTKQVSAVAKHQLVRQVMVDRQRKFAKEGNVVMDGRDIGSHVIPDAEVKIFLIASVDERAERRYKENIRKGYQTNLEQLKKEIATRDKLDTEREVSPLIKADDAVELDTTSLSIDQVVERILNIIKKKGLK